MRYPLRWVSRTGLRSPCPAPILAETSASMIPSTSTCSASRRKSTSPSNPLLRRSYKRSTLPLTTVVLPTWCRCFVRKDDAVVCIYTILSYTTLRDTTYNVSTKVAWEEHTHRHDRLGHISGLSGVSPNRGPRAGLRRCACTGRIRLGHASGDAKRGPVGYAGIGPYAARDVTHMTDTFYIYCSIMRPVGGSVQATE